MSGLRGRSEDKVLGYLRYPTYLAAKVYLVGGLFACGLSYRPPTPAKFSVRDRYPGTGREG